MLVLRSTGLLLFNDEKYSLPFYFSSSRLLLASSLPFLLLLLTSFLSCSPFSCPLLARSILSSPVPFSPLFSSAAAVGAAGVQMLSGWRLTAASISRKKGNCVEVKFQGERSDPSKSLLVSKQTIPLLIPAFRSPLPSPLI
eukprot:599950-Hanusia_phi.AAC.1